MQNILEKLRGVKRQGDGWIALCPAHDDTKPSLSISKGRVKDYVFHCHAGCSYESIMEALGIEQTGLALEEYAEAKQLPVEFLESVGLSDRKHLGKPSVRIAYFDELGQALKPRYRIALTGDRFRWAVGAKVVPYGLWYLKDAKEDIILCEGESDCHTFWHYDQYALGCPGAGVWKHEWADYVKGIPKVYVWQETDQAGENFVKKVGKSLPDVWVILPEKKDISEYHIAGEDVSKVLQELKANAAPFSQVQEEIAFKRGQAAKPKAKPLLQCTDILSEVETTCERMGLVGEARNAKLLYLAVTSRVLDRPISTVIKGVSSGGKSYLAKTVLELFPETAYYTLSGMSDHALVYSNENFVHRFIFIQEAVGVGEYGVYLLRTLLSEGHIDYEVTEKSETGEYQTRHIMREGPTGALFTTTRPNIDRETETRMMAITVQDTKSQTSAIMKALAEEIDRKGPIEFETWHSFQVWLESCGKFDVTIPYATKLAEMTDPTAVRMRRDFKTVLSLIQTHAILHQSHRETVDGRIVANREDYTAIYELVHDLIEQAVQAAVSEETRETVRAVEDLYDEDALDGTVSVRQVAEALDIDYSAAWRRVVVAISDGYIVDEEKTKYKKKRLKPGDPLPEGSKVLPTPEELFGGDF